MTNRYNSPRLRHVWRDGNRGERLALALNAAQLAAVAAALPRQVTTREPFAVRLFLVGNVGGAALMLLRINWRQRARALKAGR